MADVDSRHEVRDVPPRVPVIGIGVTMAVIIAAGFLVWLLLATVWQPSPSVAPPVQHEAIETPAPRLQRDPGADLAALRTRMNRRLTSLGWVDRDAGLVHIPIDQAMTRLLERGLPGTRGGATTGARGDQ